MFATTTSRHSTPRSMAAEAGPLPSFVVTSSNDTLFSKSGTKAGAKAATVALNPEAREFRASPSLGGAIFATPSAQPRWTSTATARDQPSRLTGSPHASPPPAMAEPVDAAALMALTEAHMHELYDRKCQDDGLHMVSVFHLHPRTTNKQLSSMFFPTGAAAAEVLEPRLLPEPLAAAFHAVRQRAGAVFFARKDFAMVGIEKIHDFVPHGQHQPLVVRYVGPDAQVSPLSGSPLPMRSHSGEKTREGSVPSPPVPSPPSGRPTPLQVIFRDPSNPRDAFLASHGTAPPALSLEQLAAPEGAAAAAASTYDLIDQHFLQKYAGENVFLVGVHNLAHSTSAKSFFKMFYPMGALNSELLPRPVSVDGKLRCSGVAIFGSKGMAMEAAEKINDFVPHGQRRPVVARFLDRDADPLLHSGSPGKVATAALKAATTPIATASTPRAHPASGRGGVSSAAALLLSIERQLRAKTIGERQLAADLCALVLCNESGEAEARQLAELLRDTLQSMGDHSTMLSSPLSGALRVLHGTLGLRMRNAPAGPADVTPMAKKGVTFLQAIGRAFMMLVADTAAPRQSRIVAAVQCAYLYQYTYLPKTPLCFATALFQNCSQELRAAKAFLCREPEMPSSVEEEHQHAPWLTLIDALQEMVKVWRSLDPRAYAADGARDEFERFMRDFKAVEGLPRTPRRVAGGPNAANAAVALPAVSEPGNDACTPRQDALEVCGDTAPLGHGASVAHPNPSNSAKKSQLVTPSARPTPRRVVSKSFSTTSDWKGKQSTPVTGTVSALPPQVMLSSPASDYTQGASEFSAESNPANPFNSALRSLGLSPQNPCMRFNWGSRFSSAVSAAAAAQNATATTAGTAAPAPTVSVMPPARTSSPTPVASLGERSDAAMTECTVYITKLPSCFSAGQVRRLLLHFGEFRKVRLCHDDKETTRGGSAEALAAHQLKFHKLCFGFVEFAEAGSAKAMVEFFRNEVHTAAAFDFLRTGATDDAVAFDEAELNMLRSTRTSQARNPIHDQQPVDAICMQPCLFGILRPQHTIETYADVVTAEEAAAAAKEIEETRARLALPPQRDDAHAEGQRVCAGVFSTATAKDTPVAAPSTPANGAPTLPATTAPSFSVSSLEPMEAVHFPRHFPYHYVFSGAREGALEGSTDGYGEDAPVVVEDDDDEGLQEYQVQQILQLLN